jgi:hypothetical protein
MADVTDIPAHQMRDGQATMIDDEMVNKFNAHFYCAGREGRGHVEAIREGLAAILPAIEAAAFEKAAAMVETHCYTTSNREPFRSLQPSPRAKDDLHHQTIATAIRSLAEKET